MAACITVLLLDAAAGCQTALGDCVPNPAGLVGWWPGDGSANNVLGTNNGTFQGGATASAPGRVGTAFNFDGTNGYVQIPNSTVLQPTNLTIECWVKFSALDSAGSSSAGDQYIVFKQNTRSQDFEGFDLSKSRVGGSDYFRFLVVSASGQAALLHSSTAVSTGVWYHVAAVRGSNFTQLYVNGLLERQTNVTFAQSYGNFPLYFGTTGQPIWDHKLRGNLDEVAIYNRALSSNEITAIYVAGATGKCKAASIVTQPLSQAVVSGTNVNFTVTATGFGPLSYRWQLNGANLTNATNASLAILNVQLANAGNYTATVSNTLGATTSAVAVLTIISPPLITNAPQSQTVAAGANANFNVGAGGTSPLSYQWRKGGAILSTQTNASLTLLSVSTNDAGNFDVIVSNVAGMATSTPPATLTVNVPPFITTPPQNQTTTVGLNVSFSVAAGGTPPLSYQWRKSGLPITGQTGTTLTLSPVSTNDAGTYEVVVANVAGVVTSAPPAILTVNIPPFITNVPQSQTVTENSSAGLTVGAGGTAPLSYQWRKGGSPLGGQTGATLNFGNVTLADAGSYDVVVANVAGSVTSTPPAVLTVTSGASGYPSITIPPWSQTVAQGANVTNTVVVNGLMPLRYHWRKQGDFLVNQTNATLVMFSVVASDAGDYDVVVTNSVGAVTSTPPATLVVISPIVYKPSIAAADQPRSQRVGIGTSASFSVGAGGTTPLSYQWRKDNSPIAGQTDATLALSNVSASDDGDYDVVVTNMAGSVTSAVATLAVKLVVDPRLEKAISCALTNQPAVLTISDLQALGRLSARNRGITNLFGLQFATNLTSLDVSQNTISDLTSLQGLVQLDSLELDENLGGIDTLSPLSGLINLRCLVLNRVSSDDYAPLSGLTNLINLAVREGSVAGLDFIKPLTRLASLAMSQNYITNVSALAGLTNLSSLDLRWNVITNHSSLWSGPTNLKSLYLGGNPLSNAPSLLSLPRLAHLSLDGAQIRNISPLAGLTNLSYLDLSRNSITNYSVLSGLTKMVNLELSGNTITNLGFIANLWRLTYLNLAYSGMTNLSLLTGLTNLNGLVLAGNRISNFTPLSAMPGVSNLWLHNASISNASWATTLPWLNHLNLDDNYISSLTPLLSLTNLTGLGLSRNPATNFPAVASLTKLTSLRLEGDSIANVNFLTNLFRLTYLSLNQNRITNALPLGGLTNMQSSYLRRNRLRAIQVFESLPRLCEVDVSLNLLHSTNGSPEWAVIESLNCRETGVRLCACAVPTNASPDRGVNVIYLPQHHNPTITITTPKPWFIPTNIPSLLNFTVDYEVVASDALPVTGISSNQTLIPNANLAFAGTNRDRTLTVTPATNQTGETTLTLTVANEAGLTGIATATVSVSVPTSVTNYMQPPGAALDPILESAIRSGSGKSSGELTTVDLLNVASLSAQGASFAGFTGWQWLTNMTTLHIGGSLISNLNFLTNFPQLTSLGLFDCAATDYSPVAGLTKLIYLDLVGKTISDLSFLGPLTKLNSLQLGRTRVAELAPMAGLTNLSYARLPHNLLTNILPLYNLPMLSDVDISWNLLDIAAGSSSLAVIQGLSARGVSVVYTPQRTAPVIPITPQWNISANRTSTLTFEILENDKPADVLAIGVVSSNPGVVPSANIEVSLDFTSTTTEWALRVTPATDQTGTTAITLLATNDVGLHSSTSIVVTVSAPLPLDDQFFGMTDLTWQTGGNVPWFGQTTIAMQGFPAAQSGGILHGETSTLESTLIGPGTLSFWWKVSSETNYDFLEFESPLATNQISGEVDWEEQIVWIPPRTQNVRWLYTKDLNAATGMDASWIAHVTFVPATWLDLVGAPTNAQCDIVLYGISGQEYAMETSTNAINWLQLGTVLSTNRITPFVDTAATNAARFYRARAIVESPVLGLSDQTETGFGLTWPGVGVLEASPTPNGPWREVGGVSPFYVSTEAAQVQFFRVKVVGD